MLQGDQTDLFWLAYVLLRKVPLLFGLVVIFFAFVALRWLVPWLIDVPEFRLHPETAQQATGPQSLRMMGADFLRVTAFWMCLGAAGVWILIRTWKFASSTRSGRGRG